MIFGRAAVGGPGGVVGAGRATGANRNDVTQLIPLIRASRSSAMVYGMTPTEGPATIILDQRGPGRVRNTDCHRGLTAFRARPSASRRPPIWQAHRHVNRSHDKLLSARRLS